MFWCANLACLCIHCIDCNEKTIHGTLDLINGTLETTVNGTRSWISCIRFYIWYQYSEYKAFTFYIIILEWLYVLAFSSTGSRTSFIILKLYVKEDLKDTELFHMSGWGIKTKLYFSQIPTPLHTCEFPIEVPLSLFLLLSHPLYQSNFPFLPVFFGF